MVGTVLFLKNTAKKRFFSSFYLIKSSLMVYMWYSWFFLEQEWSQKILEGDRARINVPKRNKRNFFRQKDYGFNQFYEWSYRRRIFTKNCVFRAGYSASNCLLKSAVKKLEQDVKYDQS